MNTNSVTAATNATQSSEEWLELAEEQVAADRFSAAESLIARARSDGPSTVLGVFDRQRRSAALHLAAGEVDLAAAVAEAALELIGDVVTTPAEVSARAVLAVAAMHRGDVDRAHRAAALLPAPGPGRAGFEAAAAWLIVADPGQHRLIRAQAADVLAEASWADRLSPVGAAALVPFARHCVAEGLAEAVAASVVKASRALRARAAPTSRIGTADQACAILRADPNGLERAVRILRTGARPLALAEALVDLSAAAGTADGSGMTAEAMAIFNRYGAAGDARRAWSSLRVRPDHAGPERGNPPLTEAELRVARLVADGLTNRRVASRLRLSPHTVDSHLRSIFGKLEIASRVELARRIPATAVARSA